MRGIPYRFLFLFHPARHLRHGPVDGRVLGQIRKLLRQIDRHRLRRIEGPRPKRKLGHFFLLVSLLLLLPSPSLVVLPLSLFHSFLCQTVRARVCVCTFVDVCVCVGCKKTRMEKKHAKILHARGQQNRPRHGNRDRWGGPPGPGNKRPGIAPSAFRSALGAHNAFTHCKKRFFKVRSSKAWLRKTMMAAAH